MLPQDILIIKKYMLLLSHLLTEVNALDEW